MSKLSQLKQDAYQAGKKRNWDEAVALYERILEVDKNNPTVINELGDLCLKAGKTPQGVRHFLSAAAKYRQTGLLNNAVAIYKKILRYEAKNLNAHWYLAETRSSQALVVEGEIHALHFLESSEKITGDIKEIFLKRCVQLLELYPESEPIQAKLIQLFRTWDLKLEAARASLLHAAVLLDAGSEAEAKAEADGVLAATPEIRSYPEFQRWQQKVDPNAAPPAAFADHGAVDLDAIAPEAEPAAPAAAPAAPAAAPAAPAATPAEIPEVVVGTENDGSIAIDAGGEADFDELIAAATAGKPPANAPAAEAVPAAPQETPADSGPTIDLLAEILADDADLLAGGDDSQLQSITREIGAQVGGDGGDQDPESLYSSGTVYLEMGMNDQAAAVFGQIVASGDPEFALRAREMWGEALLRDGRHDEAVEVMRQGLVTIAADDPAYIGMLYNIGKACESAGRKDEAVDAFAKISAIDPDYLDVGTRLTQLTTA